MPIEKRYYRAPRIDPETGHLITAGAGYYYKYDFNETSDARPQRGWGGEGSSRREQERA
jgi:hypothetical protein